MFHLLLGMGVVGMVVVVEVVGMGVVGQGEGWGEVEVVCGVVTAQASLASIQSAAQCDRFINGQPSRS